MNDLAANPGLGNLAQGQSGQVNPMFGKLLAIDPPPTDADVAKKLRAEMNVILEQVCRVQSLANASGMRIEYQLGIDGFGRHIIGSLNVLKVL